MPPSASQQSPADRLREGLAQQQAGQLDAAAAIYKEVLTRSRNHPDALHLLGIIAKEKGDLASAEKSIRAAIDASDRSQYHNTLAVVLMAEKRYDEAEEILSNNIKKDPELIDSYFNLAVISAEKGDSYTAIDRYKTVIRKAPEHAEAMNNLGTLFTSLGGLEAAEEVLEKCVATQPTHALGMRNLARVRRTQGRFEEALELLEEAVRHRPNDNDLAFARALTLLSLGLYETGWTAFEARYNVYGNPLRHNEHPSWDGTPMDGTLLIHTEQGHGDAIQFARFLPRAVGMAKKIIVECLPAQVGLFQSFAGVDQVVGRGDALPAFDAQAPLLRLPLLFGIDGDDLPGEIPYLNPADVPVPGLPNTKNRLVGLVGGTTSGMAGADRKSLSMPALKRLLAAPGITFVNLQPDLDQTRKKLYASAKVLDAAPALKSFSETAAYLRKLDLTLSVDTATAHLAGAMGRPVWVLLNDQNDWRWTAHTAAHWYPAARLFRQRAPDDWIGVVGDVLDKLGS